MENSKITITDNDGKLNVELTDGLTWPTACLMLFSTISNLAETTVDVVYNSLPDDKKSTEVKEEIAADIADMINYAASNILNKLSPKDPDLQLSEIAIATMENEIIQKAAKEKKSIKQALKEYEAKLLKSPYAAKPLGQNGKEKLMACKGGKKTKGGKGGKGGK